MFRNLTIHQTYTGLVLLILTPNHKRPYQHYRTGNFVLGCFHFLNCLEIAEYPQRWHKGSTAVWAVKPS